MGQRISSLESRVQTLESKILLADYTIGGYKKEIETLRALNASLNKELSDLRSTKDIQDRVIGNANVIDKKDIDEYVRKLLEDPEVNIPYLPDYVERQIYKNVFSKIYGLLGNIMRNAEIVLPGNRIIHFRLD